MSKMIAGDSGQPPLVAVFDNVAYDVVAGPGEASPLVDLARTEASRSLDIDNLVVHLNRADELLDRAAGSVSGLPTAAAEKPLGVQIMDLQYLLRGHTAEVSSALAALEQSARSMVGILRGAFRDWYSLHEDDAFRRFARCAPIVRQTADNAAKLETAFLSLAEQATSVLRIAEQASSLHRKESLAIDPPAGSIHAKRAALEAQMSRIQALGLSAPQETGAFAQSIARSIAMAFGHAGGDALSSPPGLGSELAAALADANRSSEKAAWIDMLADLRKCEREATTARTRPASNSEEQDGTAVSSLRNAVATLRQIAAALGDHKLMWTGIAAGCARLTSADLAAEIERYMKKSREERIGAHNQPGFALRLLAVAARWQALQLVAAEGRQAVQAAYVRMGQTFAKNPATGQ